MMDRMAYAAGHRRLKISDFQWLGFLAIALCAVSVISSEALGGAPKLESIFPPGAARGTETEVTAAGQFDHWPAQVWCDRPDLHFAPSETKGTFRITIDKDATPGIAWLRIFDEEGATALRPFLVGEYPEITESEPNNAPSEMKLVNLPAVVNGRLAKGGDVDGYTVALKAGETLNAAVQAHSILGSPIDSLLQVCELIERPGSIARPTALEAFVLEQNHDEVGLDPLLGFRAERDGTYAVRLFAYPSEPNSTINFTGSESAVYRLTLTTGNYDPAITLPKRRSPHPIVEALTGDTIQSLTLPATIRGNFSVPDSEHVFSFAARKGDKFVLQSASRSLGFRTMPALRIIDQSGTSLANADGGDPKKETALEFTAPTEGTYRLQVRDAFRRGGPRLNYELDFTTRGEDFKLSVAADTFVLSTDKPLEIPVVIGRRKNFEAAIDFKIPNLPAGVSCEAVRSEGKEASAKEVKLVLKTEPGVAPASVPFTILGVSSDGSEVPAQFASPLPLDQPHDSLWLTVRP